MKKLVALLAILFLNISSFSEEKTLVIFLYNKDSSYFEKINNKIVKNKYISRRINKYLIFKAVSIDSNTGYDLMNKYYLPRIEGVYFINPNTGKLLYKVLDLSKPCKCANLINYFSRKLYNKGISPDKYLIMAEKLGAYQKRSDDNYLLY